MAAAAAGRVGLALLAALALTLSAAGPAAKYLGDWAVAPLFAVYVAAALVLERLAAALSERAAGALIAGMVAALSLAFVVVFPLADSGAFGPGSDRDEALNLAAAALFEGRPLYADATYLGNPATPLPGAVLLAAPFAALGEAAWQNLLWLPALAALAVAMLGRRAAAAYLALFVAGNPAFLRDYLTGGDYAVNAIYVAAALTLAPALAARGRGWAVAGGAVLGVAMLSRPVYGLALILAAGAVWRRDRAARAAALAAAAVVAAAAVALPVYLADPDGFAPLHVRRFAELSPLGAAGSAALALAATVPVFLRGLGGAARIGLLALGLAALLAPPVLAALPEIVPRLADLTTPVALLGGLWLTGRLTGTRASRGAETP